MATTPTVYTNFKPTINVGGLSPLQLALLNYLYTGTSIPLSVNKDWLAAMVSYGSSDIQTPLEYDTKTGLSKQPDLVRDLAGVEYRVRGDDVYLYRRALDCGMDENRYEEVWIGKTYEIAQGTYTYYGRRIYAGSEGTGSAEFGTVGQYDSPGNGGGPTGGGGGGGMNADGSVGGVSTPAGAPSGTVC